MSTKAYSAEGWSLKKCIDYARENNIQVLKSQTSAASYQIDVLESKAALFPSLTGSTTQEFSNAKVEKSSGDYRNEGTIAGEYNLTASLTLYNGGRNKMAIKQAQMNKSAQDLTTKTEQNTIELSITEAYLQILYYREAIKNYENLVLTSEAELKQALQLLNAGSSTKSDYAQVEAEYSSAKYDLVTAQTSYENYCLDLKQLLELAPGTEFEIEFPEISDDDVLQVIPAKDQIYNAALSVMPEVENGKLNIDIAKLTKQSAKGGYLPTLSLTGNIGTGNTYTLSPSFLTQLNRNFNQSLGLTLSIPIFDNRQNKSNVQKADLTIRTAELDLLDTQKTLYKTIEGLYQDAVAAQSKYLAAKDKVKSTQLSYQLVEDQYKVGATTAVTLTTQRNSYANALQELLQAKYTALLSLKLLNFYQGQSISL